MSRMRLLLSALVLLPGCLFIPYAFPTISHRPALHVNAASDQVLAIWATRKYQLNAIFLSDGPHEYYEANRCQLLSESQAPLESQSSVVIAYGIAGVYCCPMALFLPLPGFTIAKQEPILMLYRPGYRLQRIYGWSDATLIAWEPAETIDEQLEALGLISTRSSQSEYPSRAHLFTSSGLSKAESTTYHNFMRQEWSRLAPATVDKPFFAEMAEWHLKKE